MIGRLASVTDLRAAAGAAFAEALAGFDRARPIAILSHFDADGLAAAALLSRALERSGRRVAVHLTGKGETPWDPEVAARLRADEPGGLILADLGTRIEPVLPGVATLVIDHHVPTGDPAGAIALSGNGLTPEPTTALLAWWAAGALGDMDDLRWLAAIGLIGDMEEGRDFPELAEAQTRWGKTALRDAVSLINAPRRSGIRGGGPARMPDRRCACCCAPTAPRRSPRAPMPTPRRCAPPSWRCARRWTSASVRRRSSPAMSR